MALSFATDIRPRFRQEDITAMIDFNMDLGKYDDVKKHAKGIYAQLKSGNMPCDGPWADDAVQQFKTWMDDGMLP